MMNRIFILILSLFVLVSSKAFAANELSASESTIDIEDCKQSLLPWSLSDSDYRMLRKKLTDAHEKVKDEEHWENVFTLPGVMLTSLRVTPFGRRTNEQLKDEEETRWRNSSNRQHYGLPGIHVLEFANGEQTWFDFIDYALRTDDLLKLLSELGAYKVKFHTLYPSIYVRPVTYNLIPLINDYRKELGPTFHVTINASPVDFLEEPFGFTSRFPWGFRLAEQKIAKLSGVDFDEVFPDGITGDFAKLNFYLLNLGLRFTPGSLADDYFSRVSEVETSKRDFVMAAIRKMHELHLVYVPQIFYGNGPKDQPFGVIPRETYDEVWRNRSRTYTGERRIVRLRTINGVELGLPWAEIVQAIASRGFTYDARSKLWVETSEPTQPVIDSAKL